MHKENPLRHPHLFQAVYSPLKKTELELVDCIIARFGDNVQIFYQRRPSRNNHRTEPEKAFEKFVRNKFGKTMQIDHEAQEFVRITKPNGLLKITTTVPDYRIRLGHGRETFTEITTSSKMNRNGNRKRSKHSQIMEIGFGRDVDSIIELKEPRRTKRRKTRSYDFRVLLPNGKMRLVRISMQANSSTKQKTETVAKRQKTKSIILFRENLEKMEEKNHISILYDRSKQK